MLKIIFMGTPDFSVPVLDQLVKDGYDVCAVVTQPDRPKGRKRIITPPPVKEAALKHQIPVYQPEKLRDSAELQQLLALQPDLIVTAAYGQILPLVLLEAPKLGCINVHASLLPQYRGGAPIHKAIIDGKKETGVTIMYMVEKLDAGDILTQVVVPIEEEDNVGSLHDKLSMAGAALLSDTMPKLMEQSIEPKQQEESLVTYAWNITREEEKIDWSKDGEAIYNQIRGLHPWPVAFTILEGKPLKVWWGQKVKTTKNQSPGEIIAIEKDGFVIGTGNETAIKLVDIQPSGKKRMTAEQFLNGAGNHLQVGMKLGD
ncbi:methionyl-tRNA formyltransferase [Massilibacterium senegalense]|uniref:methionyl-tRNA formyltransferase n=1 Tax=Massilibacterium senegalense TaxID=1632858 RepID=UPI00078078F0|nr:methionyl-tRNA formyltransferase [Massilibacterium senegalense]